MNSDYNNGREYDALHYINSRPDYSSFFDPSVLWRKSEDKRKLRRLSLLGGGALLVYILVQYTLIFALQIFGISELYGSNDIFQCAFDIILSIAGMYLPFALFGRAMQKISGEENPVPLGRPLSAPLCLLAVVAGLGLCMVANYVTSIITIVMALFGIELSTPDIAMPTGALGVTLTVVRIGVVAAVVEESAMRGFVMGNLRRYGDGFAIVMSAFLFGFMHGNLIQAPFALIAGMGLGYLSVKTGTLWTGIVIHFLNNMISVSVTYLSDVIPEETLNIVYGALIYILMLAGIICFLLFNKKTRHIPLRRNETALSISERIRIYLLSPTMVAAFVYMLAVTATFISAYSGE